MFCPPPLNIVNQFWSCNGRCAIQFHNSTVINTSVRLSSPSPHRRRLITQFFHKRPGVFARCEHDEGVNSLERGWPRNMASGGNGLVIQADLRVRALYRYSITVSFCSVLHRPILRLLCETRHLGLIFAVHPWLILNGHCALRAWLDSQNNRSAGR